MNAPSRLEGLLGIAAKAGKLTYGTNLVCEAIRRERGSPTLVLLAEDASENSKKRIKNCCAYYQIEWQYLPASVGKEKLSNATGRPGLIACVGIHDKGFSEAVKKLIQEEKPTSDTAGGRRIW